MTEKYEFLLKERNFAHMRIQSENEPFSASARAHAVEQFVKFKYATDLISCLIDDIDDLRREQKASK